MLYDLPNVMITPHIAGSRDAEQRRMSRRALRELELFLAGEPAEQEVVADELAHSA